MTKFSITITENDIRERVECTISDLIDDREIAFPSDDERTEFTDDLVQCIVDKYANYGPFEYSPKYSVEVLDLADLYGYSKD